MFLVIGNEKVLARDRIADLVLVPEAIETDTCLKQTLLRIIVKAEEVHGKRHCLGRTSREGVIVNSHYASVADNVIAKGYLLKNIAFLLTRDAGCNGSGASIWKPCKADSTPECWNIRITKLQQKAKLIFGNIVFPSRPSTLSSDDNALRS